MVLAPTPCAGLSHLPFRRSSRKLDRERDTAAPPGNSGAAARAHCDSARPDLYRDLAAYLSARVAAAGKCIGGVENAADLSRGLGWPSEGGTAWWSLPVGEARPRVGI